MKYARIIDNIVVETFTPPNGFELKDCFHPSIAEQFIPVKDEVEAGWIKSGEDFVAPEIS